MARLKDEDKILYFSCLALRRMQGELPELFSQEILGFLDSRHGDDYLGRYIARCRQLADLQKAFELTGRYSASNYSEVENIDAETYRLSLLLSFLTTNHRFEILQWLIRFIRQSVPAEVPRRILSIGFGAGYEVKVIRENCPNWEIFALDNSQASHSYASDLLKYFGYAPECLQFGTFPLETDDGIEAHHEAYGKIVMCEVLEHLEQPEHALRNLRRALSPHGQMYLTMAINIAQEDHVFRYSSAEQARRQVLDAQLCIVDELITPVMISPYNKYNRTTDGEEILRGNYVCIARRA
jgi:2-polyprenyl-3-methyl-5-hydroxy-6-metoxy-1,4-benzoquinol methylase